MSSQAAEILRQAHSFLLIDWPSRDVPDTLNAILEYPEGFTVSLSSTFNNEFSQEAGFQILGTEGTLVLGGAETTFSLNDSYRRVEQLKAGFYQLVA